MESGGNVELGAYQDNNSGQTRISIHDCPLSKSTCKLLNRVVPNGTLRGVEGEGQISPIRCVREEKGAEEDLKNGDGERYIFRKNARQLQAETV